MAFYSVSNVFVLLLLIEEGGDSCNTSDRDARKNARKNCLMNEEECVTGLKNNLFIEVYGRSI